MSQIKYNVNKEILDDILKHIPEFGESIQNFEIEISFDKNNFLLIKNENQKLLFSALVEGLKTGLSYNDQEKEKSEFNIKSINNVINF